MEKIWKIPQLKVKGDTHTWYQQNQLLISKIFLDFSESNQTKFPADVIELLHTDQCEYRIIITIHNKENIHSVLKKCLEVFVDYEEYELAHKTNNMLNKL